MRLHPTAALGLLASVFPTFISAVAISTGSQSLHLQNVTSPLASPNHYVHWPIGGTDLGIMLTAWPQPTKGKPLPLWDIEGCMNRIQREFDHYAADHPASDPAPLDPKYSQCKYGLVKMRLLELNMQRKFDPYTVGEMSALYENLVPGIKRYDFACTTYVELMREYDQKTARGFVIARGSTDRRGANELSAAPEPTGFLGSVS